MNAAEPEPAPAAEPIEVVLPRLRPRLKRLLHVYRIPVEDAEDILQEAFLAACRSWDSIRCKESWLVGTVKKKCILYWKRQRTSLLQAVDAAFLETLSEPPPPPQEREEMIWDLETLALGLCSRHRTVLRLRYGLGLSTSEVAARLGYCPSSIRKLTCRSVERLQRLIDEGLSPAGGAAE
jgi:RNA polymerase sigma factor (sigma-70 family)